MNQAIEKLAEEMGITAAEANELLTNEERAELETAASGETPTPVATATAAAMEAAAQPTVPVLSKDEQTRLFDMGKATAREIEQARSASDAVARTVLLRSASELAGKPASQVAYLDGFATGLLELGVKDTVVKQRKAEAKAVVDAYSKVIAENLDEAREALVKFTGGYHAFIDKCREIRGVTRKPTSKPTVKSRLNDTESERAKDLMHGMSAGQAADASVVIASHILSMKDGELALIRMVANVYLQTLSQSRDAGIAKWAGDARSRALEILEAADKARPESQVADHTSHGVIAVPQPAVEQQKAA